MIKLIFNYQLLICDMTVDCKKVNFCLGEWRVRAWGNMGLKTYSMGEGVGKAIGIYHGIDLNCPPNMTF